MAVVVTGFVRVAVVIVVGATFKVVVVVVVVVVGADMENVPSKPSAARVIFFGSGKCLV